MLRDACYVRGSVPSLGHHIFCCRTRATIGVLYLFWDMQTVTGRVLRQGYCTLFGASYFWLKGLLIWGATTRISLGPSWCFRIRIGFIKQLLTCARPWNCVSSLKIPYFSILNRLIVQFFKWRRGLVKFRHHCCTSMHLHHRTDRRATDGNGYDTYACRETPLLLWTLLVLHSPETGVSL